MRWTILTPAVPIAALALAAPASAALSDFRLPDTSSQQPPPDRQGPVAPDVPASRAPRATPAPTPAPTAAREPAPSPTVQPPPFVVPPVAQGTPAPARSPSIPAPLETRPTAEPAPATAEAEPATLPDDAPPADNASLPAPGTAPRALPTSPAAPAAPREGGIGAWWLWALAALAVLGMLALAGWLWRRKRKTDGVAVPKIERPQVVPATPVSPAASPTGAAPTPAFNTGEPLQVALDPLRLSLTLFNATLAYRLEIANRGTAPIVNLRIGADMISAHASMTREQQLAGPGRAAATVQRIERLEPGESRIVEGEFRVPFSQIVPIRQGNAALLLPLARFRLEAESAAPVVRTFAVGQPGPKAGLQPFRLDLGPRVYPKLTQRAFA